MIISLELLSFSSQQNKKQKQIYPGFEVVLVVNSWHFEWKLCCMLGNFSYFSKTLLLFTQSILTVQQDCIDFLLDAEQTNQSVLIKNSEFHHMWLKFSLKWTQRPLFLGRRALQISFSHSQSFSFFFCTVILLNFCSFIFIVPSSLIHISSNVIYLKVNFSAEQKNSQKSLY